MIEVAGKKLAEKDIPLIWPEVKQAILDCAAIAQLPISVPDLKMAEKTLIDWVKSPEYGKDNLGAYVKHLDSFDELAWALFGNVRAAADRQQEEVLAWLVIGNVAEYETLILDPLIAFINILTKTNKELEAPPRSYGPLVDTIRWNGGSWSVTGFAGENHERLYLKVGFIHSFSLSYIKVNKVEIPGRKQSEELRKKHSKGSLMEENLAVYKDRLGGISVWAGTSGSTMDIIWFAKEVAKMDGQFELTCLAWCAFAFFHIMPTSMSPTHTFTEVMRGAKSVAPEILYDPTIRRLPWTDPVSKRNVKNTLHVKLQSKL
jgi:hypothetical protein